MTHVSSTIERGSDPLPICCLKSKTSERNVPSRLGSQVRKGSPRLCLRKVLNSCRNLPTSATRCLPHDGNHNGECFPPPSRHNEASFASSLGTNNPYTSASAARKAVREVKSAADNKAAEDMRRETKMQEINCWKSKLTKMEARFTNDHKMGDRKEEHAACHSAKKEFSRDGRADPSSVNASSTKYYSSLARVSKHLNKKTQVLSPAANYAGQPTSRDNKSTSVTEFFEPGGEADQTLAQAIALLYQIASHKTPQGEVIDVNDANEDDINGVLRDFLPPSNDEGEYEFGKETHGTSPFASIPLIQRDSDSDGVNHPLPGNHLSSPPCRQAPALRSSSFASVKSNTITSMDNAFDVDPAFFEGTAQDGKGPGPHFITMLFIKDTSRIRNQLLKALTSTVSILTKNLPNALIHCIQKNVKLPPLSSVSDASFPTTRMQARNYLFVQNQWSLTPGMRNRAKLPAPKVGKDGCQLFDKNRGYKGPDRITAVMWVMASCNVKDALTSLQMELEGKQLQIRWKPTQKKNSRNQIVIYSLPPGFDQKGIMQELLYGLKE
jgi:hypothetical protein